MTTITVKLSSPVTTIYFNPSLPRANKIQVVGYYDVSAQIAVFCDIVNPLSWYSNYVQDKFGPSQLLAIIPSKKYPSVKVQTSKDPINSMKFLLVNEKEKPPNISEGAPFCICLRIYD